MSGKETALMPMKLFFFGKLLKYERLPFLAGIFCILPRETIVSGSGRQVVGRARKQELSLRMSSWEGSQPPSGTNRKAENSEANFNQGS